MFDARRWSHAAALATAALVWAGGAQTALAQSAKPSSPQTAAKGEAAAAPLPPAAARLWLIAPSPSREWTLRIDNVDDAPVRVPADVRLLRFEIETWDKKRKKTTKCAVPASMRPQTFPEDRALYLAPGESYIESFDPRLVCFGKDAQALAGAALVRTRFGWDPPPKGSKKIPAPPYAVQGTDDPPSHAPLRELLAPAVVLSYGGKAAEAEAKPSSKEPAAKEPTAKEPAATEAPKKEAPEKEPAPATSKGQSNAQAPAPFFDAAAARLELTQDRFIDAAALRNVSVSVTATNEGQRPMTAALRPRMLSFRIDGPTAAFTCDAEAPTHALPREGYRTIKPKEKVTLTVLLAEICPRDAFPRPGLYRVSAALEAGETGEEVKLDAYTALVPTSAPTLLRLQTAPERFYTSPPKPVATPKPPEPDE